MKNIIWIFIALSLMFGMITPHPVYAQTDPVGSTFGTVQAPQPIENIAPGQSGAVKISTVLSAIVKIIYMVGAVAFIFMIVWGAVGWITSGGDKEKVAQARSRITWAIIGFVVLALSFMIFAVLQRITGFEFFRV